VLKRFICLCSQFTQIGCEVQKKIWKCVQKVHACMFKWKCITILKCITKTKSVHKRLNCCQWLPGTRWCFWAWFFHDWTHDTKPCFLCLETVLEIGMKTMIFEDTQYANKYMQLVNLATIYLQNSCMKSHWSVIFTIGFYSVLLTSHSMWNLQKSLTALPIKTFFTKKHEKVVTVKFLNWCDQQAQWIWHRLLVWEDQGSNPVENKIH
jgi:hypothetical protein